MGEANRPDLLWLGRLRSVFRASASGERQRDLTNRSCKSSIKMDGFCNPRGSFVFFVTCESTYFVKISNKNRRYRKRNCIHVYCCQVIFKVERINWDGHLLLRRYQNQVTAFSSTVFTFILWFVYIIVILKFSYSFIHFNISFASKKTCIEHLLFATPFERHGVRDRQVRSGADVSPMWRWVLRQQCPQGRSGTLRAAWLQHARTWTFKGTLRSEAGEN